MKEYSDQWYEEMMGEGFTASQFHPSVNVWSEMGVRLAIINAIQDHDERNKSPDRHIATIGASSSVSED